MSIDGHTCKIIAKHSGMAVSVANAATGNGAKVIQWPWHEGDEQLFFFTDLGNNHYRITPKHSGSAIGKGANFGPWLIRERLADDRCKSQVVAFFDCFTAAAKAHDIGIHCILFRCPTRLEKDGDWGAFVDEFSQYCRFVAATWGGSIATYQIWNESNHILASKNALKYYSKGDAAELFVRADQALQAGGGDHISMINVMCNNDWLWESTLTTWLRQIDERCHDHRIRTIGIDHYPGTWTVTGYEDWWPMERVTSILENKNYNWAISETGFASSVWKQVPLGHTPEEQARWMEISLGQLYKRLRYNQSFRDGLQYINLYQLYDIDPDKTTSFLEKWSPFEAYFGVCDFNGKPKPAFSALQQKIAEVS